MTPSSESADPVYHYRSLAAGQVAELRVRRLDDQDDVVVHTSDVAIEAPNWSVDGRWLVFNADGAFYRVAPAVGSTPQRIDISPFPHANNDHVLSPDGRLIYFSSSDGHLYRAPWLGGLSERLTEASPTILRHYLHGISPDGSTLAFVGLQPRGDNGPRADIFCMPSAGGPISQLTHFQEPSDGPEFTPDGSWIYFNSERGATSAGHAQIFRIRPDGSEVEQLTRDDRVNWFPHISPDGRSVLFLTYPRGTQGHPANVPVELRIMAPDGSRLEQVAALFGGQGTLNVNGWAPDSRSFAYVAYPLAEHAKHTPLGSTSEEQMA